MSKKLLMKSTSIISSATLLSRVLGFARVMIMAQTFGTGWIAQAFFVAFRIPNMLRDLAGEGASNAAFVPVFSEYLSTKSRKEFWHLIGSVFIAFITVVTFITLIGILFSPLLVRMIAPGFIENAQQLVLTVAMNRVLFIYLILISTAAFLMGVLHTFQSFLAPSLFPSVFNVILIGALFFADNSMDGIRKLVIAILMAGVVQIGIQIPPLWRRGLRIPAAQSMGQLRLKNIIMHPGVQKIGRLLVPRILGTAIYQLNILVDTIFASLSFLVGPGAIAAIFYAARLLQFPLGIFGNSIASATLPVLSAQAAKNDMDGYVETVTFSLTNILFVMIPSTAGLMVLSKPLVRILFEHGEFGVYSTMITSTALVFYSIGLTAYALNKFFAFCFNALQDTATPVKISGLALLINVVLNVFFVVILRAKIAGLALASSLSIIISASIMYLVLQKRVQRFNSGLIVGQMLKMIVAGLVMAASIHFLWNLLAFYLHALLVLVLVLVSGAGIYFLVCRLLNVSQAKNVTQWLRRRK